MKLREVLHLLGMRPRPRTYPLPDVNVDAEGYDYQVLMSLRNLIAAERPFIKAEVLKLLSQQQRERLYDLLIELQYHVFVTAGETCYRGEKLARPNLMHRRHYDIFCVPAS